MAKKQKKEVVEKPAAAASLAEDLAHLAERAELADELEVEKDVLEEDAEKLRARVAALTKENVLLKQGVDLTAADLEWCHRAKAEITFDREFSSGKFFVRVKGTHPGMDRKRVQAPTLPEAMKLIRGTVK